MSTLKDLAEAWTLMWGLSYIIVALVAPSISSAPSLGYAALGCVIVFCLFLMHLAYDQFGYYTMAGAFLALGTAMTYGAIVSWTGTELWNIPFSDKAPFQISMAFADMISAVCLFVLAKEMMKK